MRTGIGDLGLLENFSFERGPFAVLEDFVKQQPWRPVRGGSWGICTLQKKKTMYKYVHSNTMLGTHID